jgi:hypothetical protein
LISVSELTGTRRHAPSRRQQRHDGRFAWLCAIVAAIVAAIGLAALVAFIAFGLFMQNVAPRMPPFAGPVGIMIGASFLLLCL